MQDKLQHMFELRDSFMIKLQDAMPGDYPVYPLDLSQKKHQQYARDIALRGVEEIFEVLNGVDNVVSGYAGGTEENPSYKQVGSGSTSHAEAIEISYNPDKISYEELLKVYFNAGDITQVNGQGNDRGTQYRSILFYNNAEQKQQIDNYIKMLENSGKYNKKIAVEVLPASKFYIAEKYHQNYVKLNPNQGYVRSVSIPRYEKAIKNFPELLK